METTYVQQTYEHIANHFDKTRTSIWKGVGVFLDDIPKHSLIGDFGCGNGKYTRYRSDVHVIAIDLCTQLVNIVGCQKTYDSMVANCLHSPFRQCVFDFAISIAVLHHVSSPKHRHIFLQNIIDSVRSGGRVLFTVWAVEQPIKPSWESLGNQDYFVPWHDKLSGTVFKRYYHLFTKDDIVDMVSLVDGVQMKSMWLEGGNWYVVLQVN